ncbi:hypothetical protein SEMRO_1855_G301950.1 [Seminavis robusta]|uniref:Uncharacterized protein n=1 Tax=Seminavis robusta TaxID=568900 RepID=A0A9N8HTC6_9STRA|nr:hypothetical protein SEMRO_1855_G301950.1 [Seminavis robusta]|eukprot:Sro1855_g301950.1 n/a (473) ;mRNA; f:15169-17047
MTSTKPPPRGRRASTKVKTAASAAASKANGKKKKTRHPPQNLIGATFVTILGEDDKPVLQGTLQEAEQRQLVRVKLSEVDDAALQGLLNKLDVANNSRIPRDLYNMLEKKPTNCTVIEPVSSINLLDDDAPPAPPASVSEVAPVPAPPASVSEVASVTPNVTPTQASASTEQRIAKMPSGQFKRLARKSTGGKAPRKIHFQQPSEPTENEPSEPTENEPTENEAAKQMTSTKATSTKATSAKATETSAKATETEANPNKAPPGSCECCNQPNKAPPGSVSAATGSAKATETEANPNKAPPGSVSAATGSAKATETEANPNKAPPVVPKGIHRSIHDSEEQDEECAVRIKEKLVRTGREHVFDKNHFPSHLLSDPLLPLKRAMTVANLVKMGFGPQLEEIYDQHGKNYADEAHLDNGDPTPNVNQSEDINSGEDINAQAHVRNIQGLVRPKPKTTARRAIEENDEDEKLIWRS